MQAFVDMHFDMVFSFHASNWSMDICTCGFALLVYMHEYTSKCKRNVFGPVWVHMVAVYTPDPSGKPIWQWNITPVRMGKRIYVQLFR